MIQDIGIPNAANLTVQETATLLPNARGTLLGRLQPLQLVQIVKTVVNLETVESELAFECRGAIQPLTEQELKIVPEGQRMWIWKMLHTTPEVNLKPDEVFLIRGERYRVKGKKDYFDFGIIGYFLLQDYDRTNPAAAAN